MIESKRNLTPVVLVGIFCLMLGLSYAAVPLYELFCRVTGFGGTVRIADKQELPNIVINQDYQVRFDTNTHSGLDWDFKVEKNGIVHVSIGKVSFESRKILDNAKEVLNHLVKIKPSSSKGVYMKSISMSSTMSPGIKIDTNTI